MKALKTILFAAMATLAIGAVSCSKENKKSENAEETTQENALEALMDEAAKGQVAYLTCDTVLTSEVEVDKPTVVYFFAQNAPSCAPLNDPMDRLAYDNEGNVAVIGIDVAACPKTAASFGLDAELPLVPYVVIMFPDGKNQTYSERSDFISAELENKSADEQADGIYAVLLSYAGLEE